MTLRHPAALGLALPRRRFLQAASLLALPTVGSWLNHAIGQTPDLPALPEIALDRSEPGLAVGRIVAAPGQVLIDGRVVQTIAYNGVFPGPLLRLREGETLRLTFENRLDHTSNLHFHGLSIPPTGRADNIWIQVPAGESFEYEFVVPPGNAGVHWYHPHIHGATARDMFAGLAGPILIEGPRDFEDDLDCDDRLLVLKDVTLEGDRIQPHRATEWSVGKEGDWLLVNGVQRPVWRAQRSLQRLRFVNASNARYWRLRLGNDRPFHVIAHDGRYLDHTQAVQEILLVPGGRAEVLVELDGADPLQLIYLPTARRGMAFTAPQPIATLLPPPTPTPIRLPTQLVSFERFRPELATVERDVVLSLFNICSQFMDPERVDIRAALGSREIWRLRNVDVMDHPFHLHTWHYQVLDIDGKPPAYAAQHDMFNVREGANVRIGIHFTEHVGRTLYHCHFTEHSDRGMMAILQVS